MRSCGPRFRRWPECVPVAGVRLLVQGSRVRKDAKLERTEFAAHRQKAWLVGFLLFWDAGRPLRCRVRPMVKILKEEQAEGRRANG